MGETGASARNDVKVARHTELANPEFLQGAVLDLPVHAHAWNDSDAHAHLNETLDAFDGGHFHRHIERRAVAREELDDAAAKGRFNDVGDEVFFAEFLDFDFAFFCQRVLGRNDESEFVLQNFGRLKLRIARDKGNRAEIEAVVDHFVGNIAGEHAMKADLNAGVGFAEASEGGEEGMDGALVDAEGEFAALEALEFHEALFDLVAEIEEAFGVLAEKGAGVGEADGARPPDEERLAEGFLELTNGEADGGLGTVEAFGSPGETAFAGNSQKDLQFS